jgi:hypothetical protein
MRILDLAKCGRDVSKAAESEIPDLEVEAE